MAGAVPLILAHGAGSESRATIGVVIFFARTQPGRGKPDALSGQPETTVEADPLKKSGYGKYLVSLGF